VCAGLWYYYEANVQVNASRPVLVQRLGRTFGVSYNINPVYILEAISIFASLIRPFPN